MRVLMVSKACIVGAYQTKLEELARLPGMQLLVIVPPFWRDPAGTIPLERQHTAGYELAVEEVAFNGNYHLHFYPRLGRAIRRFRPDLVHIDEEPYNLATAHALWLSRRAGARTLFFSWQNILRRYPLPFRAMERYVLRHVQYGIVGNEDSVEVWRAKGYQGPLRVIPQFGVDPQLFSPAVGAPAPGGPFVVGFVGRLVPEKGVDLLLEAVSTLSAPWRAVVLGRGPSASSLQRHAQRLAVAERITFAGSVPSTELPAYYRGMDVLVLPSRTLPNWKEQFGRTLVEAMACGVPVVGSDSGEIPSVIGDAGLTFPEGNAGALRERLAELVGQPALGAELGRRGRDRVLARFTQAHVAAQTYEVYREVLGAPHA